MFQFGLENIGRAEYTLSSAGFAADTKTIQLQNFR